MDFFSTDKNANHWGDIVNKYEKRNAALEVRQSKIGERIRAMECALPSMLMSAVVSMQNGSEPPKIDFESIISRSGIQSKTADDSLEVELVYKRGGEDSSEESRIAKSLSSSRFATGDDVDVSVVSSRDLIALGRIQELAEQERLLKRYICDLESRERTFRDTLERANKLLNDPLEVVESCLPICTGSEQKEPLSDDPVIRRLQKLEFYNKKMITSMKGLREEKNELIKQTELLKSQLRSTQEKLGEVQREVLGYSKVIPVMGEPSFTEVRNTCSCASTSNRENNSVLNKDGSSTKTLVDLAEKFEDVLEKAKNHGLCKLSGPIKDAAMKLKQLSESEEGYKCICDCPCESIAKQDCPCQNCKCGKFDIEKFGETGDWFCDSCGGDCVCDLVSLDEDSLDTDRDKSKICECGCKDDKIACECGCGISKLNEVDDAGDIPKTVARILSEELCGIICKDCGNCKCGDDHSKCPGCVEACRCLCTAQMPSSNTREQGVVDFRESQDSNALGPRCPCSDSGGADKSKIKIYSDNLKRKFVSNLGKKGDRDLHPCFECEQPEPCDDCLAEEFSRLDRVGQVSISGYQRAVFSPCEQCIKFATRSINDVAMVSRMCNLCQIHDKAMIAVDKTREIRRYQGNGDKGDATKNDYSVCPCSCNAVVSLPNADKCLCGCGVTLKTGDETNDEICPCGCLEVTKEAKISGDSIINKTVYNGNFFASLMTTRCDCESAKNGTPCDYCCCIDSVIELLNDDKILDKISPKTCPCIEESMRDTEMERLAVSLEQDVDAIGRKNNVLRQLVARRAFTSPKIIEDPFFFEGCPYHDAAPIRPTISGLQTAVEILREKNRRKDGMIAVLAENLHGNVDADKIANSLTSSSPVDVSQDFDQCRLYNYLKEAELDENSVLNGAPIAKPEKEPLLFTASEITFESRCGVPPPGDFKVVKRICNDSLLVSWTQPEDISTLNGYELLVNGVNRDPVILGIIRPGNSGNAESLMRDVKGMNANDIPNRVNRPHSHILDPNFPRYLACRVRSPTRTETLLVSLDTSRPLALTLYSIGPRGSCSKPVRITYPPCPCVD